MKKILLGVLVFIGLHAAQSQTENLILEYTKAWQPIGIKLDNKVLTIAYNQDRITKEIYNAILQYGICASSYTETWEQEISEIQILNKHAYQGFVFEGGHKECNEAGKLIGDKVKFYILNKTHLY